MSLFDNPRFQYRDTYLVFFPAAARPQASAFQSALSQPGIRLDLNGLHTDGDLFESVSIEAPEDNTGMDVAYAGGREVREQIRDLLQEFRTLTLSGDDARQLGRLKDFDARFDVLLFEPAGGDEDDMDPGSLLIVIERLCAMTGGIGIDPQSMSLL